MGQSPSCDERFRSIFTSVSLTWVERGLVPDWRWAISRAGSWRRVTCGRRTGCRRDRDSLLAWALGSKLADVDLLYSGTAIAWRPMTVEFVAFAFNVAEFTWATTGITLNAILGGSGLGAGRKMSTAGVDGEGGC